MGTHPPTDPEAGLRRFLAAILRYGPEVTPPTLAQATQLPVTWIPWYEAMAIAWGLLITSRHHRTRLYYLTPAALTCLEAEEAERYD